MADAARVRRVQQGLVEQRPRVLAMLLEARHGARIQPRRRVKARENSAVTCVVLQLGIRSYECNTLTLERQWQHSSSRGRATWWDPREQVPPYMAAERRLATRLVTTVYSTAYAS